VLDISGYFIGFVTIQFRKYKGHMSERVMCYHTDDLPDNTLITLVL